MQTRLFVARFGPFGARVIGLGIIRLGRVFGRALIPNRKKIHEQPTNLKIRSHRLKADLEFKLTQVRRTETEVTGGT